MILARAKAKELGIEIRQVFEDGTIVELQGIDDRGQLIFYKTGNRDAAKTISTDKLYPGGSLGLSLTGSSMTAGEWDGGGVRLTHQELTGRVTQVDSSASLSDHATHVAGTIMASGVDSSARGMAYGASLDAYDWTNDDAEMAAAAGNGMLISNHSYGNITGWFFNSGNYYWYGDTTLSANEDYKFGFYNSQSAAWDQIARNAPYYLIVKSAGNDRGDSGTASHFLPLHSNAASTTARNADGGPQGYDCISTYSGAKNILTVGAVNAIPGGYSGPSSVVMSSFSGWGPTDDGRIKPDVVANGVGVYSSLATNNSAYASWNGTSMATPSATGSLLLLQEHYYDENTAYMKSATLKALAIHTADEAGPSTGPDYQHGWGLLNMEKAAEHIADTTGTKSITETSVANGNTYTFNFSVNGFTPIRATIAWTDVPGTPTSASNDPTTAMLVNDLDIRIIRDSDSTVYFPYVMNPGSPSSAASTGDNFRDNVEQIYIASPSSGSYTLVVSHKGTLSGGSSQDFSLILDGGIPPLQPLNCAGIVIAPAYWNFDTLTNCSSNAGAQCVIPSWYGWVNDTLDNIDWTVRNGGTPSSGTGPSNDYNTGTSVGKYLYTEASTNGTGFPNKQAILYSPCISLDTMTNSELAFAYHMSGSTMGTMSVEIFNGYNWNQVWTKTGDQDTLWQEAAVDISNYDGDTVKIRFIGITGSNYESDMAIDGVQIREFESCPGSNNFSVSSITDSTAIFSWSSNASFWKIRLDIKDSITVIPPSTINFNPVLFTGLIANTTYDIFIQDSCGANDTSAWIGPITFTTTGPIQNPTPCGMNAGIPDNTCPSLAWLSFEVTYPGNSLGTNAFLDEVKVIIDHSYDADLQFGLTSPAGDTVMLSVFNGGSGDNYGNPSDATCSQTTNFRMDATNSITSGTAPFIGTYKPQGNFTDFYDGSDPNGLWKFIICDNASSDVGQLEYVELIFDSIPPQINLSCSFVVDTFPSYWSFDTLNNCSTTSGSACPLPTWYGWTNDTIDNIDWTVDNGGTPSTTTGPSRDYSMGNAQGKYLYTEASTNGTGFPGKEAILYSPCFDLTSLTTPELVFAYNMFGSSMGTLSVEVSNGSLFNQVWTLTGNQDTSWHEARINLATYTDDTIQVRFVGLTGNNYWSDMAIDAVEIREEVPCSDPTNPLVYNITDTTANFSWTSNASFWRIKLDIKDSINAIPQTTINFNPVFFFNLLPATTYEIYIQDSCTNGDTSNWVGPIEFTTTGGCVSDTIFILNDGPDSLCLGRSVTLYATGSQRPNVQWYKDGIVITGQTFDTLHVTTAGRYNAIFTDGTCSDSALGGYDIYFHPLPNVIISMNPSDSICQGDSVDMMTIDGDRFQWYFNGNALINDTTRFLTADQEGIYNVMVVDSNKCMDSAAMGRGLYVFPIPTVGITNLGTSTFCEGSATILQSTAGDAYQWYRDGQPIVGSVSDTAIVGSTGNYNVVVTNGGTCSDSAAGAVQITVNPKPDIVVLNLDSASTLCDGDSAVLVGGPAGTFYQWYKDGISIPGANTNALLVKNSGRYNVLISDFNFCTDSALNPPVVNFNPLPNPTINTSNGTSSFCDGDSLVLSVNGMTSHQWFRNSLLLSGETSSSLLVLDSGNYDVLVTDSNSCSDTSSALQVSINSLPNVLISNLGNSAFCLGDSATLTTATIGTYQWYQDGSPITGATSSSYDVFASGRYNVVVTDPNQCSDSSGGPIDIATNNPPVVTISGAGVNNLCIGDSLTFISSSGVSYQWYKDGNVVSGETDSSITITTAGRYNVIVTDSNACSDSASWPAWVYAYPKPTPILSASGSTNICSNDSVVLTASPGANTSYWTRNGVPVPGSGMSGPGPNIIGAKLPGLYNAVFQDTVVCTDSAMTGILVTVRQAPVVTINSSSLPQFCAGDSTVLSTISGQSYQWYFNGVPLSGSGSTDSVYTARDSGLYNVVVTDANGCSDSALTPFSVMVYSLPDVNIVLSGDSIFCNGDSVVLSTSGQYTQYLWRRDGQNLPGGNTPFVIARISGDYNVIVTDNNNCTDSAAVAAKIIVNPKPVVSITANDSSICFGDTAILTATPGFSYSWRRNGIPISGAFAQSYMTTDSGYYNVIATDGNFCSDTAFNGILIRVLQLPTVSLDSQPVLCNTQGATLLQGGNPFGGVYTGPTVSETSGQYFFDPSVAGVGTHIIVYTYTDANMCVAEDSKPLQVDDCVGIDEIGDSAGPGFYPNPTRDIINVSLPDGFTGEIEYWVYDMSGHILYSETVSENSNHSLIQIDLSNYVNGAYFLRLKLDTQVYNQKVILEKNF